MVSRLDLFRDGDVVFIVSLDERCPNSLWLTTGVEPASTEALLSAQVAALRLPAVSDLAVDQIARSICRRCWYQYY